MAKHTAPKASRMPQGSSISAQGEAAPHRAFDAENRPLHRAEVADRLHPRRHHELRHHPAAEHRHRHQHRPAGAAAACSVRPSPAIIIMKPTKPTARAHAGEHEQRVRRRSECRRTQTPIANSTDLQNRDRRKAGERLAAEHLRARQRRHLQPHERAVHAFADQADREAHHAADDAPHDALRKRDLEAVGGPRRSRATATFVISSGCQSAPPAQAGGSGGAEKRIELAEKALQRRRRRCVLPAAPEASPARRRPSSATRLDRLNSFCKSPIACFVSKPFDHRRFGLRAPGRCRSRSGAARRRTSAASRAESGLDHDERRALLRGAPLPPPRSGRPIDGEVAGRLERRHERLRPVGVVLVHDDDAQRARRRWLCPEKTKPNSTATTTGQTNVKKSPDFTRSRMRRSLSASADRCFAMRCRLSPHSSRPSLASCGRSGAGTPVRAWPAPCEKR